jgi:Antitoxin-like ribbon-helix-helix
MVSRAKLTLHPAHATNGSTTIRRRKRGSDRPVARSREGTKLVGAHVPAATWRELHQLRGELDVTMQALLIEAIEDIVNKYRTQKGKKTRDG